MQGSSKEEAGATNMIVFPEARTLIFENLPSLVSFGSDDLVVKWPTLEDVTVKKCPIVNNFGLGHVDISQLKSVDVELEGQEEADNEKKIAHYFELSDKFSSIKVFDINDTEELGKTLAMKLKPSHFTNLVQFQAKHCNERLNGFLSILLERSEKLECLTIKECKTLKHVFSIDDDLVTEPDGKGNGKYLPRLKEMILLDLPQLSCIWNKDPTGIFGLGHLEKIEIQKCGSLKNLMSASAAEKLQELRVLRLLSCENIEEVVSMEAQGLEIIKFPLLRDLELRGLSNLIKFHRGNCALVFPCLRSLRINDCPQMIAFTTGFASAEEPSATDERSFTMLSELELGNCGQLRYVIPTNMLPGFQNLEKLTVSNCNSLEELFPFHGEFHSAVPMLPQLKTLSVKDCNSLKNLFLPFVAGSLKLEVIRISDCRTLEEIFVTKEDMNSKILVSDLKSIALENLPKLSTFSPGTFKFPSLERLKVLNCPALKKFVSGFNERKHLAASSNNYFFNSESLERLKELHLNSQDGVEKLWNNNLPSESFCKLEEMIVNESHDLLNVLPFSMLIRFDKLKNMTVEGCKLLNEVFDLEKDISDISATEMLPQISVLVLNNLPSLIRVWNKEPQVPVFQNLASLQIIDCDKLSRLFSLSTAKYLQNLKLLKLYGCKHLEEVFVGEEGSPQEIKFPMVECLILKHLPILVSFCQHSCTFTWPKLKIVRVSGIPYMKTFSHGDQSTPLLKTVYVTFIKKCWQGDLNSTIKYLHSNEDLTEILVEIPPPALVSRDVVNVDD